jgi:hypothetical protein
VIAFSFRNLIAYEEISFVAALLFLPLFFAQVNDTANYFPPPPGNNPGVSNCIAISKTFVVH